MADSSKDKINLNQQLESIIALQYHLSLPTTNNQSCHYPVCVDRLSSVIGLCLGINLWGQEVVHRDSMHTNKKKKKRALAFVTLSPPRSQPARGDLPSCL